MLLSLSRCVPASLVFHLFPVKTHPGFVPGEAFESLLAASGLSALIMFNKTQICTYILLCVPHDACIFAPAEASYFAPVLMSSSL